MNGTLLVRVEKKDRSPVRHSGGGGRGRGSGSGRRGKGGRGTPPPQQQPQPVFSREPDLRHNKRAYYFRPGAIELVDFLARHPAIDFCFYTSMQEENARAAVDKLLRRGARADLFSRQFNKHDPEGEKSWDTMRDLEKLWDLDDRVTGQYDENSTLMIDDTTRKMREHPQNVAVLPEYTMECINQDARISTRVMRCVERYISELVLSQEPVPAFVGAFPFHERLAAAIEEQESFDEGVP